MRILSSEYVSNETSLFLKLELLHEMLNVNIESVKFKFWQSFSFFVL